MALACWPQAKTRLNVGVQPKGRDWTPGLESGGDWLPPSSFHPPVSAASLFRPETGRPRPAREEKKCGSGRNTTLRSVLRTDAAALKTKRKQRFLDGNAVCLNAPLALLNVAPNAALSTPAAFQVPVPPVAFTPRKAETSLRSFTSTGETRSLQMRPHGTAGQFAPSVCLRQSIGAICQRPAARSLPGALTTKCARHRSGWRYAGRHWRSGFALRGLDLRSPE